MQNVERWGWVRRVGLACALVALGACAASGERPRSEERPSLEPRLRTFLMFEGRAEEALEFYTATFPDSRVLNIERYVAGEPGPVGTLKLARVELLGQEILCFDSPAPHPFTFTPSISFFVICADEAEIARLFGALSQDGEVLMPLGEYGFSRRFAWVADRFGVPWQLNLP